MKWFDNLIIEITGFLFFKKPDAARIYLIIGLGKLNDFMNIAPDRHNRGLRAGWIHDHGQSIPGPDGVQADAVYPRSGFECE